MKKTPLNKTAYYQRCITEVILIRMIEVLMVNGEAGVVRGWDRAYERFLDMRLESRRILSLYSKTSFLFCALKILDDYSMFKDRKCAYKYMQYFPFLPLGWAVPAMESRNSQ
jgi:hypothetical protein